MVEIGCWRWCRGSGAGAGAVSWLRRRRQVDGAGAGAVSWLRTWWRQFAGADAWALAGRRWRWCCELAVRVVHTGCWRWRLVALARALVA